MISLNLKEIESVLRLDGKKRYEYFIKKVTDSEIIWGLYQDGWALASNNQNENFVPLWPCPEYASLLSKGDWVEYKPSEIDLYEFIDEMAPKMKNANLATCIFLTAQDFGVCVEIDRLIIDLQNNM